MLLPEPQDEASNQEAEGESDVGQRQSFLTPAANLNVDDGKDGEEAVQDRIQNREVRGDEGKGRLGEDELERLNQGDLIPCGEAWSVVPCQMVVLAGEENGRVRLVRSDHDEEEGHRYEDGGDDEVPVPGSPRDDETASQRRNARATERHDSVYAGEAIPLGEGRELQKK